MAASLFNSGLAEEMLKMLKTINEKLEAEKAQRNETSEVRDRGQCEFRRLEYVKRSMELSESAEIFD